MRLSPLKCLHKSCAEFVDIHADVVDGPKRPAEAQSGTIPVNRETTGEQRRFQLPETVCTAQCREAEHCRAVKLYYVGRQRAQQ